MLKIPLIGKVVRLIASAVGASVCECVLLLLAGSYAFYKWASVLVVVPLAARLVIGRQAGRKIPFLRLFALCMFVTVLTGGIVTALDSFFSSDATVMICFGFVISYIVLKCFCERSNESRRLYRVTLLKDGKRACATALYDTGNLLKKQPEQLPVHIGGSALFDIVGEDAGFFDVPYKSLGNDGGSIKVCEFDEMTVMKGNGKLILHNVLVGRASDSLFENNAYDMILNEAVFSNKTGMENTLGSKPHTNEVFYIGGTEVLPPPLETDEEKCCLIALVDKNVAMSKEQAKKQLIEHNLRLVVYLAKKFENTGVCVEDLISIGTIGLIKGINTFNPEKKIKLATYASRCIENEILMYLRRNNRVKLEVSFDEPLNTDWDGNELLLSDILGTDEDVIYKDLETEVEISLLKKAMLSLNERERQIIELRFGVNRVENKELTQKEVADILGISQSYISRLEKKIMARLKKEIQKMA